MSSLEFFVTRNSTVLYEFPQSELLAELLALPHHSYHVVASDGDTNWIVTGMLRGKPVLRELSRPLPDEPISRQYTAMPDRTYLVLMAQ